MKNKIEKILRDLYREKLSDADCRNYTQELYDVLIDDSENLEKLFNIACEIESVLNITDSGNCWNVYSSVIRLLPVNEVNSRRLYELFMNIFDDYAACLLLLNVFRQYLSNEMIQSVENKAKKLFSPEALISIDISNKKGDDND